jgi:hypothetical protein
VHKAATMSSRGEPPPHIATTPHTRTDTNGVCYANPTKNSSEPPAKVARIDFIVSTRLDLSPPPREGKRASRDCRPAALVKAPPATFSLAILYFLRTPNATKAPPTEPDTQPATPGKPPASKRKQAAIETATNRRPPTDSRPKQPHQEPRTREALPNRHPKC